MKISYWVIENPKENVCIILKQSFNGASFVNFVSELESIIKNIVLAVVFENQFKALLRLDNDTKIYIIKETLSEEFFRGRRFSALFFQRGIDDHNLCIAASCLDPIK